MLIGFLLERGELILLVRLAAKVAEPGGQQLEPLEELLVVEARVNPCAGENNQPAAAPQITFDGLRRRLAHVRHVRQHHRVIVIEARLRKLR